MDLYGMILLRPKQVLLFAFEATFDFEDSETDDEHGIYHSRCDKWRGKKKLVCKRAVQMCFSRHLGHVDPARVMLVFVISLLAIKNWLVVWNILYFSIYRE